VPTPIITDGTQARVEDAPRVVLPEPALVFADRALRFDQLARGHSMGDYLGLMAALARAQSAAVGRRAPPPLAAAAREASRDYGMPPLGAIGHARQPQWRADLADVVAAMAADAAVGGTVSAPLEQLQALDDAAVEAVADRVLAGTTLDDDAALVPFVGAALQVYFTRLAASLDVRDVERTDLPTVCPVCASRPVASVVRIGGARNNLRYLCCALCNTAWNMTRILCSSCLQDKGVRYLLLQAEGSEGEGGAGGPRRAEVCDECKTYLKIFYQETDPHVDAVADDLASLGLDILVDEQGYARSGPNLLFHPGSG
jgi:FdhE protein